jgi:hypothetical protein
MSIVHVRASMLPRRQSSSGKRLAAGTGDYAISDESQGRAILFNILGGKIPMRQPRLIRANTLHNCPYGRES